MEKEEWKIIEGHENYEINRKGEVRNIKKGKILKPQFYGQYFCVKLQENIRIHILIGLAFIENPDPENFNMINHKNGIKTDNRIENLEWVSRKMNTDKSKIPITNTSGIKGVSWHKRDKKWQADIRVNGKKIHLGYFSFKEDAIKARKEGELRINGYLSQYEVT